MRAAKGDRRGIVDVPRDYRAHQGKIRVESTVGMGTAFTLKLPVAKVDAATSAMPVVALGIPTITAAVAR